LYDEGVEESFSTIIFKLGIWSYIILVVLWSLFWKGWALWVSARQGEKGWFIPLLAVNTFGVLEIIYLLFIARVFSQKQVGEVKEV